MVLAHRPGSPWETDGFLKTREIPGVLFAKERFTERVGVGAEREGRDPSPASARSVPFLELEGQGLRPPERERGIIKRRWKPERNDICSNNMDLLR